MASHDHRLDDEIQFHIEQQTAKNIRAGMRPDDARRAALVQFGGVEQTREAARDEFRGAMVRDFLRDMRIGLRTLARVPAFAAATILTFGLGLGAATAMFSVVHGVLLTPLPYPQSDRIVRLYQIGKTGGRGNTSGPNFTDWRAGTHAFSHMTLMSNWGRVPVLGFGEPMLLPAAAVSPEFFSTMGVRPQQGRGFTAAEAAEDPARVAVVSAGLWERAFAGAPLAGQHVTILGQPVTIIGVMPKTFDYPTDTAVWLPLDDSHLAATSRTAHNYQPIARLADGVSLPAAQAELSALSRSLKARYGDETWMYDAAAVPLLEVMTGTSRDALFLLLAASVLLLVVAATNVSNMLVARGATRRREFAVQLAIGATSGRIVRQLLAETFALCACGALFGLVIAAAAVRLVAAAGPAGAPRLDAVSVDWTSALFAVVASIAASSFLAIVTAYSGRSARIAEALSEDGRSGSAGRRQIRMREGMIVLEVALTLVLLAGAGLLARSLGTLLAVNPGFRTDDALIVDVTMQEERTPEDVSRRVTRQNEMVAKVNALPGVTRTALISSFPIGSGFYPDGQFVEMTRPDEFTSFEQMVALGPALKPRLGYAGYRLANGDYFNVMGIPLLSGRLIDDRDGPGSPEVAVISKALADAKWPGQDPIGRYVQFGNMDGDVNGIRIVGVVGNVREESLEAPPAQTLYASYRQRPRGAQSFSLVVRGPAPKTIVDVVRRTIHDVDPQVPIEIRTVTAALDTATGGRRFTFELIGAFAACALALAALGIYGLVAFMVAQRTREMGIRMALGAEPVSLVRLVVTRGVALAAAGAVLGLALALALTGTVKSLLYGVKAADPAIHTIVVILVVVVASLASYVPARKILRQTPGRTLRDI